MGRPRETNTGEWWHAGKLIRRAREYRGMSQTELGFRTGLGQPRLSRLEDQAVATTSSLVRIGDALDLEIGFREKRPERKRKGKRR